MTIDQFNIAQAVNNQIMVVRDVLDKVKSGQLGSLSVRSIIALFEDDNAEIRNKLLSVLSEVETELAAKLEQL